MNAFLILFPAAAEWGVILMARVQNYDYCTVSALSRVADSDGVGGKRKAFWLLSHVLSATHLIFLCLVYPCKLTPLTFH